MVKSDHPHKPHSPPSTSVLCHPPCLPLWRACGRRQTCPAGLCAAPRGEQSLGFCLLAGGRPGISPLGRTLPSGPAARPPPVACRHWCTCSRPRTVKETWISPGRQCDTDSICFWKWVERERERQSRGKEKTTGHAEYVYTDNSQRY